MPPVRISLRPSVCLKCASRAGYATSRPVRPSAPLNARSRPPLSIDPRARTRPWAQASNNAPQGIQGAQGEQSQKPSLSERLKGMNDENNSLLSPVHIPEDPNAVINEKHPAASILSNSGIVVQRQLEIMNVVVGLEQANKYVILDPQGNHIGFIAEQDNSIGRSMARQMLKTHRSFTAHIFDKHQNEVLRFHRPFSWISSRIGIYDPVELTAGSPSSSTELTSTPPGQISVPTDVSQARISQLPLSDMRIIGEAQQQWAPLRRKYNLFLFHQPPSSEPARISRLNSLGDKSITSSQELQVSQAKSNGSAENYNQFAMVDEPFLSWDFSLRTAENQLIGSVNRNWGGFGRELFTDTGVYALRMDAAGMTQDQGQLPGQSPERKEMTKYQGEVPGMTLDQRAIMLATAVSIDFDYFSRHSSSAGNSMLPFWFWGGGGEAAAAGEAAEGAGAVGEGSMIRGVGSSATGEGAAVGAGSAAAYETMGRPGGGGWVDDASPTAGQGESMGQGMGQGPGQQQQEEVWGGSQDPWGPGKGSGASGGGSDGGGGGGDDGGSFLDIFNDVDL